MPTTYRPGPWSVVVLPGALVALPPGTPPDVVLGMWERMPQQRALATVIDVLAGPEGSTLDALPSFAAVLAEGGDVRIALRGDVIARVDTASGAHELSGADVTTWSERFVVGAMRVELMLAPDDAFELPVQGGVVLAARVSADLAAHASAEPADAEPADAEPTDAEPVAEPAPSAAPQDPAPSELTLAPPPEDASWEATLHSTPAPPTDAVVPEESVAAVPGADGREGDHDGSTVSVEELRRLRGQAEQTGDDTPTALAPAATGRVRLSTGQVVALDRIVVVGRRPRSTRASGPSLPHLVAVESPQQDISRSHLEIRPEGDTVVVVDLHTTNGSTLLRPGSDPVRLHPGEPTLVVSADVVDLGDGVRLTFEDLP